MQNREIKKGDVIEESGWALDIINFEIVNLVFKA